ncbi:unnamed protein product [Closterium sp. Naga37s-1]|nr:unnamed protein product [Closterium sp. Naga37s-1]
MALRPFSVPLRVPLPSPPASSLPDVPDPESDLARAASPTVPHLLATVVTDPSLESTAASALVAELVDFAAACHLDYATSLEDFECLAAAVPHLVAILLAPEGDPDAPDISTPRSYAEVITGPYSSQWQTAMDAEMAPWKSTGTYVDAVPPSGANIVDGMWIFRVKRPPGSQPVFKARYVARGFSQRQGVDFFQTFSPTPKMTTLRVLLHVAAQRDYELHSLDFSTAFLQGSLHEEIWLRRPPGFTGSFPAGAMAAQELRLLTYLLTDLGERPRSSPVLYVDNKAMSALCQEHRLGHRTKHIALRYFLAQELQQRGELRLAYVATRANTADIFTKALQSAYGARGDGARDLQIGSICTHSATRAHKQVVDNLEKSEAEKAKQATLTRWQITNSSTRHIIRLLHIALFVCTADAPIAMFVPLCWFLAKEGLPDLPPSGGYGSYYTEEALTASDAANAVPELRMIDNVVRAFAKHIGRSSVHYQKFQELQRIFCQTSLEAQGIHEVRWLSRGEAVQRLLDVLPAAVVVLKDYKKELSEVVTSFKFHWLIRFLADVLWELIALNKRFQQRQVDVTLVAHIVEQTRMRLKTRYSLRDPAHHFGSGDKMQLQEFIKRHQAMDKREMKAEGVDGDGNPVYFVYELHEHCLPGHETDGDVTACVELSIKFVRAVDVKLEWRMRDLNLLEGMKLFRTASYVSDDSKRVETFKKWLGLLHKLHNHKLPGKP